MRQLDAVQLTLRQRQVTEMILEGATQSDVARDLGISRQRVSQIVAKVAQNASAPHVHCRRCGTWNMRGHVCQDLVTL